MKKLKLISSLLFDALTKQYHAKKDKLFFAPLAYQKFLELGLPSKQNDLYRNMGLRRLNDLNLLACPHKKCDSKGITLLNGQLVSSTTDLFCQTIQDASPIFGSFLYSFYTPLLDEETDPFYAISTALCSGLVIHVSKEHQSKEAIHIYNVTDLKKNESTFPKIIFILEKGAKLNVIIHQSAKNTGFCFLTVDCILQENSKLNVQQLNCEKKLNCFSFVRAIQKRDSLFKSLHITKGAAFCLHDCKVQLLEENAECFLNGLWMLDDKQRAHTNVFVEHQHPYCRSFQHFKGVLLDQSRSYFEGNIFVQKEAQKTDAFQLNQNLVLSDDAIAHSKPKLEIFADDVKASHGSTTVQIDQELLFYLQTRGISQTKAKAFLIEAFCKEMIEKVKVNKIKTTLLKDARLLSTT